jgi:hypothetical protein
MMGSWCDTAWIQGTNAQVMSLEPNKGVGDSPLLKIPISDAFDQLAKLLSREIMLVRAALAAKNLMLNLMQAFWLSAHLGQWDQ